MHTFNLLPPYPWYMIWGARLFGQKFFSEDDGYRLSGYHWRGKLYIIGWGIPSAGKPE